MLELTRGHAATCKQCGRVTECFHVRFWDDSFAGLLCWDDLKRLVDEHGTTHVCRETVLPTGVTHWGEETGHSRSERPSEFVSVSRGQSEGSGSGGDIPRTLPPAAESRQSVLDRLQRCTRLMKEYPDHHKDLRVYALACLRDALAICPNDILDRLLDAGRTDQPAPSS